MAAEHLRMLCVLVAVVAQVGFLVQIIYERKGICLCFFLVKQASAPNLSGK